MRQKNMLKFFGAVIIIIGVFVTCIRPLAESIKQGLDLQGGTHIVLEAQDTPDAPVTDDSVNRLSRLYKKKGRDGLLSNYPVKRTRKRLSKPSVRRPLWSLKMNRVRLV